LFYVIIVLTHWVNIFEDGQVDILFRDRKLEKVCNNDSLLIRTYGPLRAKLLKRRLDEFRAAENLEVLRSLPQLRCHELKGDREGTLAVNLDHPYRLIFEPAHDPVPSKPDGGLDWTGVTAIRVLSVEDYHG
jgi:plasmid maintenance system killer protein